MMSRPVSRETKKALGGGVVVGKPKPHGRLEFLTLLKTPAITNFRTLEGLLSLLYIDLRIWSKGVCTDLTIFFYDDICRLIRRREDGKACRLLPCIEAHNIEDENDSYSIQ